MSSKGRKALYPDLPAQPGRRRFLWSAATFALTANPAFALKSSGQKTEPAYRFATPACEVRMSVAHFGGSAVENFGFRDDITQRTFCLSGSGEENRNCLSRFVGSLAIAQYRFHTSHHGAAPRQLRERVLTIDHDSRLEARAPYEREMPIEKATLSDIQAFGYSPESGQAASARPDSDEVWYLVRQDLYMNDQTAAFLVLHWKHTLNWISLLDVIPGDGTKLIGG
jgi:hypothetical protein